MSNLRFAPENILDRDLTLTASITVSASFPVANVQKDKKSLTHRTATATTSVQFEATFTSAEIFNFIRLSGNYSPTTTIRVRIYTNVADGSPALDTTVLSGGVAEAISLRGFTSTEASSAYAYGGGNSQRLYFTQTTGKKIIIDIVDTASLQNYVETSRLILGKYWSPVINAEYDVGFTYLDETTHKTTGASDLTSIIGIRKRKLRFTLSKMRELDRNLLMNMIRSNGKGYPFFMSFFPGDAVPNIERDYEGWWKLSDISEMMLEFIDMQNITLELLEM
jgi:hypothetical protein